jgi:quercetin dioxygenase-like cupin family protein
MFCEMSERGYRMGGTATNRIPIALQPDEGEALWFLGFLVTIKASADATAGQVAVIEHRAAQGMASPLHVHRREDEWFYVTEGELTFWVGGEVITAPAGSFVYGPRDVPHTFAISSPEACFLLVAEPAGFESFVRTLATPAETLTLPPAPSGPPDLGKIVAVAAEYGIEILGPPGIPPAEDQGAASGSQENSTT